MAPINDGFQKSSGECALMRARRLDHVCFTQRSVCGGGGGAPTSDQSSDSFFSPFTAFKDFFISLQQRQTATDWKWLTSGLPETQCFIFLNGATHIQACFHFSAKYSQRKWVMAWEFMRRQKRRVAKKNKIPMGSWAASRCWFRVTFRGCYLNLQCLLNRHQRSRGRQVCQRTQTK